MNYIEKMEQYARENFVPIIRKDNLNYLINLINEHNYKNILEIGTAIGYSSICIALSDQSVFIDTIERDKEMISLAIKNIDNTKTNKQINIIKADALEVEINKKYDLIFIDGAKAQYTCFFNKYKNNLTDDGIIVSDNLLLLDLQRLTKSKKSIKLVEKMKLYKEFLINLKDYETKFIEIGDGFAITKKVNINK